MLTGELWSVDLGVPVDPEAGLTHPALVVSAPRSTGPLRLVRPVTSTRRDDPWRIEVEASPADGLRSTSYVQTEHLRAVAASRGVRRLGVLDPWRCTGSRPCWRCSSTSAERDAPRSATTAPIGRLGEEVFGGRAC